MHVVKAGKSQRRLRQNSRRGTANSKFLRARSRLLRPPGPYRPRSSPRPAKDPGIRYTWLVIFLLSLAFALGQVWKAQQVSQLCEKIDRLRSRQEELYQQYLTLQLEFEDLASYPAIEPLAREKLGMHASPRPPVVIRPVEESLLAYKRTYP